MEEKIHDFLKGFDKKEDKSCAQTQKKPRFSHLRV
jgi:hypothetical protein